MKGLLNQMNRNEPVVSMNIAGSEISPHHINRQIASLFCEQEAKDEEDGTYRRSTIEFPLGCRRLTQHL